MPTLDRDALTKGELRKLNALKKSVGPELGEEIFLKWLATKPAPGPKTDPVAEMLVSALENAGLSSVNLGLYGYTIRRAHGKGAMGLVAVKNQKSARD